MGIVTSHVVEARIERVFSWHRRPGALLRLSPPFAPAYPVQEADRLDDGQARLRLGGKRGPLWLADHRPEAYDPPYRFVDQAEIPMLSPFGLSVGRKVFRWRHTHDFHEDGERTWITDVVDTQVPKAMLSSIFAYRQRQLADDLALQARMRKYRRSPLTVAITGASGTVGRQLSALLTTGGHRVVHLVRRSPDPGAVGRDEHGTVVRSERRWDPERPAPDLLDGVDVVVHLAGATISGRFTEAHKARVLDSRVGPTRALARISDGRPFVSASAIGYYGNDRGEPVDEQAMPGTGFLAEVVQQWEEAAHEATGRTVCVRTGVVQSSAGGAMALQRPLYLAGLGGRVGSGDQFISWIALDDLLDVYYRAIVDERVTGPVNAVAPEPVANADWAKTMGQVLGRPAVIRVPRLGPDLLLGKEGAEETALASQNVVPGVLNAHEHVYRFPTLKAALRHELGKEKLSRNTPPPSHAR